MPTPAKNLLEALYKDFGEPAVRYVREMLPGATPKQQRAALDTLAEGGHPVVRKSMREAGAPLPKAKPPTPIAGQSQAEAAEHLVVRKKAPAQPKASAGVRVQPSLTVGADPRLAQRKGELVDALPNLTVDVTPKRFEGPEPFDINSAEGRYAIISMSDLGAAGDDVVRINDRDLGIPVSRLGGQDFMFDPHSPDAVWANDLAGVTKHMDMAQEARRLSGKDPLYMPFGMAPAGINFSHMPRTAMLAYEAATRSQASKRALDKQIRDIVGPAFKTMDDPASVEAFMSVDTPAQRKALNLLLHGQWATGGLGLGPARLAMTDLPQLNMNMLDLRNVGEIDARASPTVTNHPSFPVGIPGQGVGRLDKPLASLSLLPEYMDEVGLTDPRSFLTGVNPGEPSVPWSMQLNPRLTQITDKMLRDREARGYAVGGAVRPSLSVRL